MTVPPSPLPDGATVIAQVLEAAKPRPQRIDKVHEKNQYAIRFANQMAILIAEHLEGRFRGITATAKRAAGAVTGKKQLDINYSTLDHGLELGISLKSVHIRDVGGAGRYTHNMKRNEEELRIEAYGYHKRQPYAVMIGALLLPFDSCDDGKKKPSSFGSWVKKLRPYAGRSEPTDEFDRFEKIYIGLYEPDGSDLRFFDVQDDPPKQGRPLKMHTYAKFLDEVFHAYRRRSRTDFKWADGDEEPIDIEGNEES
jgi:hypothetical protein